ncbi:MAG: hypothetical protein V4563_15910 [Pseudomonadota bacterium]
MTLQLANHTIRQADRLFERAARAWVRGNNSGNAAVTYPKCLKLCERYRNEAEALLTPLGIEIDYPGLYPSFTVAGYSYHSTESAVSAALEAKAGVA